MMIYVASLKQLLSTLEGAPAEIIAAVVVRDLWQTHNL